MPGLGTGLDGNESTNFGTDYCNSLWQGQMWAHVFQAIYLLSHKGKLDHQYIADSVKRTGR
jgi:hypothetical protein